MGYIRLIKALIPAFMAVIAFLKKSCARTNVRTLQFFKNALPVTVTAMSRDSKKIRIVGQTLYNVRHA